MNIEKEAQQLLDQSFVNAPDYQIQLVKSGIVRGMQLSKRIAQSAADNSMTADGMAVADGIVEVISVCMGKFDVE